MDKTLRDFLMISKYASKHPDFIQGGGGNTSIKKKNKMVIKGSGFFLEEIDKYKGYVWVDILTKKAIAEGPLRPSIETNFHLLLGKVVIHTHSIESTILACSKNWKSIAKKVFKKIDIELVLIDYAHPGPELAKLIKNGTKDLSKDKSIILILQNHGLIISANEANLAVGLHEIVHEKLSNNIKVKIVDNMPQNKYLTPDHVVYSMMKLDNQKKEIAFQETDFLAKAVAGSIPEFDEVNYLSDEEVDFIKNMETEKHRQSILNT